MGAKIAASILTANFAHLALNLKEATNAGIDLIHFDVMDGVFVPNITFGASLIKSLRAEIQATFDVHLMLSQPQKYLNSFSEAGADFISFHWEALSSTKEIHNLLQAIRDKSLKAGLAISPQTKVAEIEPVLDSVDLVVLMTVNPGFGGQSIIKDCVLKIERLRKIIDKKNLPIKIEVDGGVSSTNAKQLATMGADILVAGSAVFNNNYSISESVKKLREQL